MRKLLVVLSLLFFSGAVYSAEDFMGFIREGNSRGLKALLESLEPEARQKLVNPDKGDEEDSPLHAAVRIEDEDSALKLVSTLMAFGAQFEVKAGHYEDYSIHIAARQGYLKVIFAFLRADPSLVDVVNKAGETPLFLSAAEMHEETALELICQGADLRYERRNLDGSKESVFKAGASSDQRRLLNLKLKEAEKKREEAHEKLEKAVREKNIEMLREAICEGAREDGLYYEAGSREAVKKTYTEYQRNIFHVAARVGNALPFESPSCTEELLSEKDAKDHTPLDLACLEGKSEIADLIASKLGFGNQENPSDWLHSGRLDLARYLLMKYPKYTDNLAYAGCLKILREQSEEVQALVLDQYARFPEDQRKDEQECPLYLAVRHERLEDAELLLSGLKLPKNMSLFDCLKTKRIGPALYFAKKNPVLFSDDGSSGLHDQGIYPIHEAAQLGYFGVLRIFVEEYKAENADEHITGNSHKDSILDTKDLPEKNTPLHLASLGEHIACVRYLVGESARTDKHNQKGKTALKAYEEKHEGFEVDSSPGSIYYMLKNPEEYPVLPYSR